MKATRKLKIINVVGARPNFMKIFPLMREYEKYPEIQPLLVHTGQHYSDEMRQLFFDQLEIPRPDINFEVGSASYTCRNLVYYSDLNPVLSFIGYPKDAAYVEPSQ